VDNYFAAVISTGEHVQIGGKERRISTLKLPLNPEQTVL
jgi:hypothetical protein